MSGHGILEHAVVPVQGAIESLNLQQAINNLTINTNEVTNWAMNQSPGTKNIILKSCEGIDFEAPLAVAEHY
jgi:hypothetical protein